MLPSWFIGPLFLSYMLFACSGSTSSKPDGSSDAWDAGLDAGDVTTDSGGDLPTGRPRLIVEQGAVACAVFDESIRDWRAELSLLGRIEFQPQAQLLPTDESELDLDLVERLEFGPDAILAVSLGTGRMSHQVIEGDPPVDHYVYTQSFSVHGQDLTLEARLSFGPDCDEIRFTDDFLGTARNPCIRDPYFHFRYSHQPIELHGTLADGSDPASQRQTYSSCFHRESPLYEIEAVTADQDRIRLNKRYYQQTFASGPVTLVWAEITLGAATREVDDYFSLIYSAVHHNWQEEYLVLLEPPVGQVHGVLVDRDAQQAVFLNAELGEISRKALVEYTGDSPNF